MMSIVAQNARIKTKRWQRGLFLAATIAIRPLGGRRYRVRDCYTTPHSCSCYDAQHGHRCKHQLAVVHVHEHGQLSLSLALIMIAGGGKLTECRKGGLGRYTRLEGNHLLGKPLATDYGFDQFGRKKLYPAVIVDPGPQEIGFELIPLTSAKLVKQHAPELYEKSKNLPAEAKALAAHEKGASSLAWMWNRDFECG